MKSAFLTHLEEFCLAQTEGVEKVAIIIVQMLHPRGSRTLTDYASNFFIAYIMLKIHNANMFGP